MTKKEYCEISNKAEEILKYFTECPKTAILLTRNLKEAGINICVGNDAKLIRLLNENRVPFWTAILDIIKTSIVEEMGFNDKCIIYLPCKVGDECFEIVKL